MDDEVTALLQAYGVALAALFATHPHPDQLRSAFETIAKEAPNPNLAYVKTVQTLQAAISES